MVRPAGTVSVKDTVLIPLPVLGGPWHVQQDQLGILGLVEDDTVEPHSRVHPPHIGLVPGEGGTHSVPPAASRAPAHSAPLRKDRWAQVRPAAQSAPGAVSPQEAVRTPGESWFPCSEHSMRPAGELWTTAFDQHSPSAKWSQLQPPITRREAGKRSSWLPLSNFV